LYTTKPNTQSVSLVEISLKTKKFFLLKVDVLPITPMTAISYSCTIRTSFWLGFL